MKMYIYTYQYDKIKKEGYKSLAMFDKNSTEFKEALRIYRSYAKSENYDDILAYLENTFDGRLRSVCAVRSIAPKEEYKHPYLNWLVHHADTISLDLTQCLRDKIVTAIYCKDCRQSILTYSAFENICKVKDINDIANDADDWHLCDKDKYLNYSPRMTIKHYFLVLKNGIIPPEYITLEVDNSKNRS